MSRHAIERLRERAPQYAVMFPVLQQLAATGKRLAVRLGPTGAGVQGNRASSHGDQVWAVIGDGKVITVMYRRSSQPATPAAFNVEEVLLWG